VRSKNRKHYWLLTIHPKADDDIVPTVQSKPVIIFRNRASKSCMHGTAGSQPLYPTLKDAWGPSEMLRAAARPLLDEALGALKFGPRNRQRKRQGPGRCQRWLTRSRRA
jgi:hypothetical protein